MKRVETSFKNRDLEFRNVVVSWDISQILNYYIEKRRNINIDKNMNINTHEHEQERENVDEIEPENEHARKQNASEHDRSTVEKPYRKCPM